MQISEQMKKENETLKLYILLMVFCLTVAAAFVAVHFASAGSKPENSGDDLHIYWKEVKCVVTEVHSSPLFFEIRVHEKDLNIQKTFHLFGQEAEDYKHYQEGDEIICILYSWVEEDTGVVDERSLSLYPIL